MPDRHLALTLRAACHDLQNYLHVLASGLPAVDSDDAELLADLRESVAACTTVTELLQALARQLTSSGGSTDLIGAVDQVLAILPGEVTLADDWPDRVVVALAEDALQRAGWLLLAELTGPAVGADGRLHLSLARDERMVTLTATVPAGDLRPRCVPHLLDPFADGRVSGADGRLELGVAHGLVAAAGGRLELDPTDPARWLRVILPLAGP